MEGEYDDDKCGTNGKTQLLKFSFLNIYKPDFILDGTHKK